MQSLTLKYAVVCIILFKNYCLKNFQYRGFFQDVKSFRTGINNNGFVLGIILFSSGKLKKFRANSFFAVLFFDEENDKECDAKS